MKVVVLKKMSRPCRIMTKTTTTTRVPMCSDRRVNHPSSSSQPASKGEEALSLLLPGGVASGPPRQGDMHARWSSGLLRHIYIMQASRGACACRRELAANGLTHARQRFEDTAVLGQGAFGVVHRGRCKRTKKEYAIKTTKPVSSCLLSCLCV